MLFRRAKFAALLLPLTAAPLTLAQAPTTAPATAPTSRVALMQTTMPTTISTTMPAAAFAATIRQLGDRDIAVRTAARDALMRQPRDALPALADAVRAAGALNATQRSSLREAVIQAYVVNTSEPEPIEAGFLGIVLDTTGTAVVPDPPTDIDIPNAGEPSAIPPTQESIVKLAPIGFDAHRVLAPGDTIVSFARLEDVKAAGRNFKPILNFADLQSRLIRCRAGEWVGVRYIRSGVAHEAKIRLGARSGNVGINNQIAANLTAAESYWNETFAPILAAAAPPDVDESER